jgi:transmembrane sensor
MTEHGDPNVQLSASDQAAEWFIRLRDRDLSAADRRKYVRWLKHSPSHISEFLRLCQIYGRVKRANLPVKLPEELSNVIELLPREERTDLAPANDSRYERRPWRFAAVACGLVLAAVVGVVARVAFFGNTIETEAGEWRRFTLADGSVVRAGPKTQLSFDFGDDRRFVELERGEAVFEVAKDPSRPFVVDAGLAGARAVGTEFGVERLEHAVKVTVVEGRVAIARGADLRGLQNAVDARISVELAADEQISISDTGPILPLRQDRVDKVDANQALAWTRGQKIVATGYVRDLISEFNRRNAVQIYVDPRFQDKDWATWTVRGAFDATDPNALVELIASDPDIAFVRESPQVLRLVPEHDIARPVESDPI